MSKPLDDKRSCGCRARDEQIAAEPQLPPLELPVDAVSSPMETHLSRQHCRPLAVMGVVENGLVRPIDSSVELPEHSRVIIVTSVGT
jgi:hypothetical protein